LFLLAAALHVAGSWDGFSLSTTSVSLVVALLLVVAMAAHILIGAKSLLKDLGMDHRYRTPVRLVVGSISLIIAVAIVFMLLS
jgi:succinate dehydrogenase hydrophobic anchor subunit